MDYKITGKNDARGTVTIDVTFDDASTYTKTMMAPLHDAEATIAVIEGWLKQYAIDRVAKRELVRNTPAVDAKLSDMIGMKVPVQK